jgi:O-antigen/teichoic acid export membrane protein
VTTLPAFLRSALVAHSLVYGIAHLASAVASLALLPLYSSFLSPRDYGIVALLEAAVAVVASLAIGGLAPAATRCHQMEDDPARRHAVWTTGLIWVAGLVAVLVALGFAGRSALAPLLVGAQVEEGAAFVPLLLGIVASNLVGSYAFAYLRAQKRSRLYLALTVIALALRIGLNVWFLAALRWGVRGFLLGAAIAGGAQAAALVAILFVGRPLRFDPARGREMLHFGAPLALVALASLAMHQADLFLLRWLLPSLSDLGLYAFAYTLAQRVNGMVLTPFGAIWNVSLYEIGRAAPAERGPRFRRVFTAYVVVAGFVLSALALFADAILALAADPAYEPAARLVPGLAGAFLLFSLHSFFVVPALLHGRSGMVSRTALAAALANVVLVVALAPRWGVGGAVVASVLTYAIYAFYGHLRYRRLDDLRYPLGVVLVVAALGAASWFGDRATEPWLGAGPGAALASATAWSAALGLGLYLGFGRRMLAGGELPISR